MPNSLPTHTNRRGTGRLSSAAHTRGSDSIAGKAIATPAALRKVRRPKLMKDIHASRSAFRGSSVLVNPISSGKRNPRQHRDVLSLLSLVLLVVSSASNLTIHRDRFSVIELAGAAVVVLEHHLRMRIRHPPF